MHVKEVLVEHPDHAVFHSATVRKLGSRAKPLLGMVALQPGESYFLVPLPRRKASRLSSKPIHSSKEITSAAVKQRPSSSSRRVSFAGCPSAIDASVDASSSNVDASTTHLADASTTQLAPASKNLVASASKSSLQVLPSSSDGVVRVKAVVTKKQLAAILAGGGDALSMVESLLTPLLKEGKSSSRCSGDISQENSFAWRPALESIPESSCPKRKVAECVAA